MPFVGLTRSNVWKSRVSWFGIVLASVSLVLIATALVMDLLGMLTSQYAGMAAYLVLPGVFITGLLLIPAGAWLVRRRRAKFGRDPDPVVINLDDPVHLRNVALVLMLTFLFSVVLSAALYEGYHYTESVPFCGQVCHTVMEPEFTAYQRSPHARVSCTGCHIGSGASWFVKSKLSGLRQVWAVATGDFRRPVPSPVDDLRPARDTCEQCHWPEAFHGKRLKVFRSLEGGATADDPLVSAVLLDIGGPDPRTGRYGGIHWHVSRDNQVEYLASDRSRMRIGRVRSISDGRTVEYADPSAPEPPSGAEWRRMDCIDCHNRPTHIFEQADQAVDQAILAGRIDPELPDIRETAIRLITADYPDRAAAAGAIREEVARRHAGHPAAGRSADELVAIQARNVFPEMKVKFGTYPSHLGHRGDSGCFRCHDERHADPSGAVISQDCDLCHTLLGEQTKASELPEDVRRIVETLRSH